MYNKIYRNMLLLCSSAIVLVVITASLICYASVKSDALNDFSIQTQYAEKILRASQSIDESTLMLQEINPRYTYEITDTKHECKYMHQCKILPLDKNKALHMYISYNEMFVPLYAMVVLLVFMGALLYLLAVRVADKMTNSIVKPFKNMFSSKPSEIYAEILPFTRAIKYKNEEIKRQTENAQEREIQLQVVTDTMNEGFILLDKHGSVKLINDFALKLFGKDLSTVKGRFFTNLVKNETFEDTVKKALDSQRSNAVFETDNSYYRIYCSPIMHGNIFGGVIILLFDVTGTYQSEKMRREFSANVSHELKTPLTSINGYAQIISNGLANNSDIPEFAGKIAKESNRLMMLIEDILRLSNLDEGAPQEPMTEFSAKEAVSEVLSSLCEKAEKRNISISCDGGDFKINSNKTQVIELIYNLCDNAIKYNKENGSVTVTISENAIVISDTGIGIPKEYTERIFERFFRVDKSHSKKVDGTGLGLSIVKHIAKQNNIEISVDSRVGEGSKFTVLFK